MPFLLLQGSDQSSRYLLVHLSAARNAFERSGVVPVPRNAAAVLSSAVDSGSNHTASAYLYQTESHTLH